MIDGYDISVSSSEQVNVWWRSDKYEINYKRYIGYVIHTEDHDALYENTYRPLEETPDLFLKFTELYEEPDFDRAALVWSRQYGLPSAPPTSMHLSSFRHEADLAWEILTLYEAALNRDAELLLDGHRNGLLALDTLGVDENNTSENDLLQLALSRCACVVENKVNNDCYQILVAEGSQDVVDPTKVKGVWAFKSLLGAMYLQMYWLMTSGGDGVSSCGYCGRIISLARPYPEGRKRRQDKRFCDDACRQAHHRSKKRAST